MQFKKNETLVKSKERKIKYVFFLYEGLVSQTLPDEEQSVYNIYKPGSYFPLVIVMSNTANRFDFKAITDVVVYKAPIDPVLIYLKKNQDILLDFTERLAVGTDALLMMIQSLISQNAYRKIIVIMLMFARRFGVNKKDGLYINIPLTHTRISKMLGLSRETVTREFRILHNKKLIKKTESKYIITNISGLEKQLNME